MNRNLCAGTLAVCIGLPGLLSAGQEQKLKPNEVPAAVKATAAKEFPNARISGWSKETEDGKVTYEASITEGTSKRDASFGSDGSLLDFEQGMKIADLPTAVIAAIYEKYGKAVVKKAERVTHGDTTRYEVDLQNAPKKEVLFESGGKVLKEE